jgi:hypothetical protein
MFVGMTPRKFIGSSCLRHPDQSSAVDLAWELRTLSRSPIVPDPCCAEERLGERPCTLCIRCVAGVTSIKPI